MELLTLTRSLPKIILALAIAKGRREKWSSHPPAKEVLQGAQAYTFPKWPSVLWWTFC